MNDALLVLAGAFLAILGGAIGDEIRAIRANARERKSIKICLADELRAVETTLGLMHGTWNTAQMLHPSYVSDLLATMSSYEALRIRLFLISNDQLRKDIGDFYKKLRETARKTKGKIGTLAQTADAIAEQRGFDGEFQALATEARGVRERLER